MKKLYFFIIILTFITNSAYSQRELKIIFLDSISKTPVNSVKVTDRTTNQFYYSGFDGSVTISLHKEISLLKCEHIAYNSKTLKLKKQLSDEFTVLLSSSYLETNPIIISHSKSYETFKSSTYLVKQIERDEPDKISILTIDDYLKNQSDINIIRPQGIFSNAPTINQSGMGDIASRTLILYEGIPLNKADDGNINWNMFSASAISNVEITKNSLSGTYGSGAMGGIINFNTYRPFKEGFSGGISLTGGNLNTYSGDLTLSYKHKNFKGFFLNTNLNATKSDGYIIVPDSLQNTNFEYIPSFLEEIKTNLLLGYDFKTNYKIELIYNFFDDKRGIGYKISEEQGGYTEHDSHLIILKHLLNGKKTNWTTSIYAQEENYFKNIENFKNNSYSLIYVDSKRQDAGLNFSNNYVLFRFLKFTGGINLKTGIVDASDKYQTSTDVVINRGNLMSGDIFGQIKLSPFDKDKLIISGGLNYNYSSLNNAEFLIENPTSATSFMSEFTGALDQNIFKSVSYNSGLRYNFDKISTWASFNKGINSPTLDDLTRSGLIKYGFKLANPNLISEKMFNSNIGIGYFSKTMNLTVEGTYNKGDDFIYYVETGQTIFGGNKPLIQKQNITDVEMKLFKVDFSYKLKKWLDVFANYTYNDSKILAFEGKPELEGKKLIYTPKNKANAGILFKINSYKISLIYHYTSSQYTDNENDNIINLYNIIDFKIGLSLLKNFEVSYSIQNIFDYQYIIYTDQLSLGRFMTFNVKYNF